MAPTKAELLARAITLGITDLTERDSNDKIAARIADVALEHDADPGPAMVVTREVPGPEITHDFLDPPVNGDTPRLATGAIANVPLPDGLRVRRPTGIAAWPLVLLEGPEKSGKTYALASLSASPRVGRTFAFDLAGDGTLDEYAPLGPYEIVEHNGTFGDFLAQLRLAASVPAADPDRPNVLGVDSMTSLWALLCDWSDRRARSREKNVKLLERDPDAEIVITNDLWNDAKARWRDVMNVLMRYPGVVVVTARGKEVAVVDSRGEPTRERTWKVEAEKTLTWDVTAWVRMAEQGGAPRLNACRSLVVDVPAGGMLLPRVGVMEHLVYEVLAAGAEFGTREVNAPQVGISAKDAKRRLLGFLAAQGVKEDLAKQQAAAVWRAAGLTDRAEITNADYAAVLREVTHRNEGSADDKAPDTPTPDDGRVEAPAGRGSPGGEGGTGPEGAGANVEAPDPDGAAEQLGATFGDDPDDTGEEGY